MSAGRFGGRVAFVTGGASGIGETDDSSIDRRRGRDDIAKGIACLASGDADWVTGVALPIDGGFLAA